VISGIKKKKYTLVWRLFAEANDIEMLQNS